MIQQAVLETVNAHVMLSAPTGAACQAEGCPWEWPFRQDLKTVFDPESQVRQDFARHVTEALMAVILGAAEYGVAIRNDGARKWFYPGEGEYGTRQEAEDEYRSVADRAGTTAKLVWRQSAGPWQEVAR